MGTLPLEELCGRATRVVIVSDEWTQHDAQSTLLHAVLRRLERAGVDSDRVTLLITSAADGHIHGDDAPVAGTRIVRIDPTTGTVTEVVGGLQGVLAAARSEDGRWVAVGSPSGSVFDVDAAAGTARAQRR